MHSTLSELRLYDKGYELQRKILDEQMYIMSCYTYKALETALHNFGLIFDSKHKHKPISYLEKPFLHTEPVKKSLDEMTDEEYNAEVQKAIMIEQKFMDNSKLPKLRIAGR